MKTPKELILAKMNGEQLEDEELVTLYRHIHNAVNAIAPIQVLMPVAMIGLCSMEAELRVNLRAREIDPSELNRSDFGAVFAGIDKIDEIMDEIASRSGTEDSSE